MTEEQKHAVEHAQKVLRAVKLYDLAVRLAAHTIPVTTDEKLERALHYPGHWDTAAYPDVYSALSEVMAAFECECERKTADDGESMRPVAQILEDESSGAWASFERSVHGDMSNRNDLWPVYQDGWQAARAMPAEPDADVRNEIIEECAMVCQRFADSMIGNTDKGAALRSMAHTFADDIRALARNGTEAT
jgi:hypothetical protein